MESHIPKPYESNPLQNVHKATYEKRICTYLLNLINIFHLITNPIIPSKYFHSSFILKNTGFWDLIKLVNLKLHSFISESNKKKERKNEGFTFFHNQCNYIHTNWVISPQKMKTFILFYFILLFFFFLPLLLSSIKKKKLWISEVTAQVINSRISLKRH